MITIGCSEFYYELFYSLVFYYVLKILNFIKNQ